MNLRKLKALLHQPVQQGCEPVAQIVMTLHAKIENLPE